jgi:hypothetical protein
VTPMGDLAVVRVVGTGKILVAGRTFPPMR